MTDKFKVGDLVFAKVRGYPAWPARVKNVFSDSANAKNTKIEVFFYGTYETAICRVEEVCDYETNKEKLGKVQKRKFFKEALEEIESNPSTDGPQRLLETSSDFQRDDDDDDMHALTIALPKSAEAKPAKKQSLLKKRDSVETREDDHPAKKKAKKSETPETAGALKVSPSLQGGEPERVSRSGRKIKPKRFLDEDDGHEEEKSERKSISEELPRKVVKAPSEEAKRIATVAPIEPERVAKRAVRLSSAEAKKPAEKSPAPLKSLSKGVGRAKDSDDFIPPTATVSPIVAPTPPSKKIPQENKKVKVSVTQQQAQKLLESDNTPEKVKDVLNKEILAKHKEKEENLKFKKAERRKFKLIHLKVEVRLLQIDTIIKANLNLDKAETKPVLQVLDELKSLKVSPIMLKKHPDIVFTIKKLRKYVGNSKQWTQTEDQKEEFSKKAGEIRQKASQIFEHFKIVLLGSKDATDVSAKFLKQISELKEKTKHLTPTRFAALLTDPCSPSSNSQKDRDNVGKEDVKKGDDGSDCKKEESSSKSEKTEEKEKSNNGDQESESRDEDMSAEDVDQEEKEIQKE
ncbi:PC4 and SFRS1-interacting protein-like [Neocloeon triangulifer]|uniref:PC4 and SFRS1-interacting protein-like n=1 Tax=Neocloeon triangulifer TaxID=2078957 RepID=UPI00286F2451|nr:PC4 and SFRS1-interacting protein-like [Neocloeon triangulifer]